MQPLRSLSPSGLLTSPALLPQAATLREQQADPALASLTTEMLEQARHEPGGGLLKGLAWLALAGYFGVAGVALQRRKP